MKKFAALILALMVCLCACGKEENAQTNVKVDQTVEDNGAVHSQVTIQETDGEKKEDKGPAFRFDGTATGDVTVEEVVVRPHKVGSDGTLYFDWEMKVRNTSGKDTVPGETVLRVWFHYLDENGDIIEDTLGEAGDHSPVKAGQASWIQKNGRLSTMDSSEVEATAFIEIYAYTMKRAGSPDVYYDEPILVDIRDFVK